MVSSLPRCSAVALPPSTEPLVAHAALLRWRSSSVRCELGAETTPRSVRARKQRRRQHHHRLASATAGAAPQDRGGERSVLPARAITVSRPRDLRDVATPYVRRRRARPAASTPAPQEQHGLPARGGNSAGSAQYGGERLANHRHERKEALLR